VNRLTPVALIAVAVSLALAGCTSDSLATDYNSNDANGNYVSPDGTTKTIAAEDRGSSVNWSGTTDRGDKLSSSDYAGKVVVLNFWYASCPPCRAEASSLEKLNSTYSDKGVVFVGVNVEDSGPTARSFEKAHGVTYPSILDADEGGMRLAFAGKISPTAVPTTLVIDAKGRVAARFSGLITSPLLVGTILDATLAEPSS
jgi:thiol-disulfide isomerase/thioredoxin